jgi:hypothetical protein
MSVEKQSIGPLKRVIVAMSAGNRPTGKEILDADTVEFIFGLGKDGLTPMERSLAGKKVGDSVTIQIDRSAVPMYFGHVLECPQILKSSLNSFYMNFKIRKIESASPREVVRAMARITSCGDSCSCGCHCV